MRIAVILESTSIKKSEVRAAIAAINIQVREHFTPIWFPNVKANTCLKLYPGKLSKEIVRVVDGVLYIKDRPSKDDGTLGYHDRMLGTGMPYGYVFQEISQKLGESWTVTLSHEVLEMLLNPRVYDYCLGPDPENQNRSVFHWKEACDAVQSQTYMIKTKGGEKVEVADFIKPLYFTPEHEKAPHKASIEGNNYLKTPRLKSFGVLPGGYFGYYDPLKHEDRTYFANRESERRYRIKSSMGALRRTERLKRALQKIAFRKPA